MSLVLGAYDFRGSAQSVRLYLEYLGLPYEEKRYSGPQEWFQTDRPNFTDELANLPYLKDGENVTYTTHGIHYYLSAKAGKPELVGKNIEVQTRIATVRTFLEEFQKIISALFWEKPVFDQRDQYIPHQILPKLGAIDSRLGKTGKWITGEDLTYIDFILYEILALWKAFAPESFAQFPNLLKFNSDFLQLNGIAAYVVSDRSVKKFFPEGKALWNN